MEVHHLLLLPGCLQLHMLLSIPAEVHLSVEIAGKRYPIVRTVFHPQYDHEWMQGDEDNGNNTVDLALVELEAHVENVSPFDLYKGHDEQGQEVLLLGQGEFGNGIRGVRGSDRALRQATNKIDEVDSWWLKFRFDAPPEGTFLEGVCRRGDSGSSSPH